MARPATVYVGDAAREYEARRRGTDIWAREQSTVGDALRTLLTPGDRVLDLAAGTGRWLDVYAERRVRATLLDVSADMLQLASAHAVELDYRIDVIRANVLEMSALPPGDWLVSTRFFNWIPLAGIERILKLAMAAGYRHAAITVRCLDTAAPLVTRARAIWSWRKKNLKVLIGTRPKGTYYMQSRARLTAVLKRLDCAVVAEHVIERPNGAIYALLVIARR